MSEATPEVSTSPSEPAAKTAETKQEVEATPAEATSEITPVTAETPVETKVEAEAEAPAQQEETPAARVPVPTPIPAPRSSTYDDPEKIIRFGDIIKLFTRSSHVENAQGGFIGFLEQKDKSNTQILVVPPVKPESEDRFLEAEFIVSSTRGEKPIADGTPLNYKQPFVLKTSDEGGFSINNKPQGYSDVVTLRPSGVKGEMYVAFEKEGYVATTHVHDDDSNVTLTCVDSNRIRKKFNKNVGHFIKSKNDAIGGLINSSNKGQPLVFKVVKIRDKQETIKYVKNPDQRRASVEAAQAQKNAEAKDENKVSEDADVTTPTAGQEQQPVENNQTEATSTAATPVTTESTKEVAPAVAAEPQAETPAPAPVVVKVAEPVAADQPSKKTESDKSLAPVAIATSEEKSNNYSPALGTATATPAPASTPAATPVAQESTSPAPAIELDNGETHTTTPGKVDAVVHVDQQPSATTIVSEGEAATGGPNGNSLEDEQVDTGCVGKCSIM